MGAIKGAIEIDFTQLRATLDDFCISADDFQSWYIPNIYKEKVPELPKN